jgi:acyl-coenzyme A synthetase/AMP-(fatty) acid ligase
MDLVRAVGAHDEAVLIVTSAMCQELLSCAPEDGLLFPRARAVMSLGSPLAPRVKLEMIRRVTPNFSEAYGGSNFGLISLMRPEDMAEHAGSVGKVFAGVEVEVVDSADRPVKPGATGFIRCRGSGVSPHVITERPLGRFEGFRDGWCYTGDIGAIDADGYVYVRGRVSDAVRRRGVDIVPGIVELALLSHPGVQDAAVIGVTRQGASEIVAVVVPKGRPDQQALHRHCLDILGADQAPGGYVFVKDVPRTGGGKIDRASLKAEISRKLARPDTGRPVI